MTYWQPVISEPEHCLHYNTPGVMCEFLLNITAIDSQSHAGLDESCHS